MRFMDPLIAIYKKRASDFPPLVELLESLKTFMKKSKSYIDKEGEETAETIKSNEQKLKEMKHY